MIGRQVSHYRIVEWLGAGGMGTVYRAEDTRLGRVVALKFPHRELLADANARARYLRNAPLAATLDHPHILKVHELCEADGEIFVVMEFVQGRWLRDRIDAGPLTLRELAGIGAAVAGALAYAHGRGIVHHDVKPENVLVGAGGLVKLSDFDSISLVARPETSTVAAATAVYLAPELLRGEAAGVASDLYSLGVLIYEMIAGAPPFADDNLATLFQRIVHDPPPPLPAAAPAALEQTVGALLAKAPGDRPESAREVAATLARWAGSA